MTVNNQSRLLSEFFAICCESVLFCNCVVNIDWLASLKEKADPKSSSDTYILVKDLTEYIATCADNNTQCNVLHFLRNRENLPSLAQSSQISATNKKIEAGLASELYRLFKC